MFGFIFVLSHIKRSRKKSQIIIIRILSCRHCKVYSTCIATHTVHDSIRTGNVLNCQDSNVKTGYAVKVIQLCVSTLIITR